MEIPTTNSRRWRSIDAVRGAVMIVMALDHLRDFLGNAHGDATDLQHTTAPLFFSRWITHFCAPTFFLLAGASALLAIRGGRRSVRGAARFLVVRGLILIVVEQTALRCFGWYFHADYHFMNAGVLYGLGGAMILLAGMLWLPPRVSLIVGLAIMFGEAGIARFAEAVSGLGGIGTFVSLITQSRDFEPVKDYHFFVSYPPIPWFGVMAFGYGLAARVYGGELPRRRALLGFGVGFLAIFVVVRALGIWDPSPWTTQSSPLFTLLSLVNVNKYPPSMPFLMLTLGVALLVWYGLEGSRPRPVLETYGRVPLFFYLVHVPLIHLIAVIYAYLAFGTATWLTSGPVIFWDVSLPGSPPGYGFSLPIVWLIWAVFVAAMYPACRWYATRRRRGAPAIPIAA